MSGERANRLVDLAARAAVRAAQRMNTLRDHYAPPGIISDDLQLELEEFMAHYDSHGHWAPQQGCMDPVCIKAGLMVQRAIESFGQQPQQAQ